MTEPITKERFVELLRPLAKALRAVDVDAKDAAVAAERAAAFGGPMVRGIAATALASIGTDWLLPKSQGGIRFGRVAKKTAAGSRYAIKPISASQSRKIRVINEPTNPPTTA